jgi:hypothetical protein
MRGRQTTGEADAVVVRHRRPLALLRLPGCPTALNDPPARCTHGRRPRPELAAVRRTGWLVVLTR